LLQSQIFSPQRPVLAAPFDRYELFLLIILKGRSPLHGGDRESSGALQNPKVTLPLADHAKTARRDHALAYIRLYFSQNTENKSSSFSSSPSSLIPSTQR
jgi:hypothetical protein